MSKTGRRSGARYTSVLIVNVAMILLLLFVFRAPESDRDVDVTKTSARKQLLGVLQSSMSAVSKLGVLVRHYEHDENVDLNNCVEHISLCREEVEWSISLWRKHEKDTTIYSVRYVDNVLVHLSDALHHTRNCIENLPEDIPEQMKEQLSEQGHKAVGLMKKALILARHVGIYL